MSKYLRTNYRLTGGLLDPDGIGAGGAKGSWLGGAGTDNPYGGFIMGSMTAQNSIFTVSAYGAMSAYYGAGKFASGYKIMPIAVYNIHQGSALQQVYATMSFNNSVFALIPVRLSLTPGSAASADLDVVTGASVSAKVVWAGFIVSSP